MTLLGILNMHYVYWIKKSSHTDFLTEGYIGYSINPTRRFDEHKTAKTVVGNNIRKYIGEIELDIIGEFETEEEALRREKELRPKKAIGWNIAIGGQTPPDHTNNIEVHQKISNTLKAKGANPYSENTHSPEARAKRSAAMRSANREWYHDPVTGENALIALGKGELIPEGWVPGRVKKKEVVKKVRGVDFVCRKKEFIVLDPDGNLHTGINLKQWCKDMGISYLLQCRNKTSKGWTLVNN